MLVGGGGGCMIVQCWEACRELGGKENAHGKGDDERSD